jgi:osmotically-inducible protein OsmY
MKRILLTAALLAAPARGVCDYAEEIASSILSEVRSNTELEVGEIEVTVGRGTMRVFGGREGLPRGVVRLEGVARTDADREAVERIARRTQGVAGVENHMRVDAAVRARMGAPTGTGPDLAKRVLEQIKSEPGLDEYSVVVESEGDGTVRLKGTASSDETRARIEQIARNSHGVRAVRNDLSIMAGRTDSEITDKLRRDLPPHVAGAVKNFSVTTQDGTVKLKGDARDHHAIDAFMSFALTVPGVKKVESDMTIRGVPYRDASATHQKQE